METQESMETIEEKAQEGYATLRDRVNNITEKFSQRARRNAADTWEKTSELVRENPATSIGIAILIGAGIGALLTAWSKD